MMFPEYEPTINMDDEIETTSNGKSFLFDFSVGDFVVRDGKVLEAEGAEALKIWIEKILKTEKGKFKIYDEYGADIFGLINSDHPQVFIQAEIQAEIQEALLKNTDILSVENFTFNREKRTLTVNFDVNSIYGTTEQEVIL